MLQQRCLRGGSGGVDNLSEGTIVPPTSEFLLCCLLSLKNSFNLMISITYLADHPPKSLWFWLCLYKALMEHLTLPRFNSGPHLSRS